MANFAFYSPLLTVTEEEPWVRGRKPLEHVFS